MATHIKTFSDKSYIEFGKGKFDDWCVYYTAPDGKKTAPRDVEYFESLIELGDQYGRGTVYLDFIEVYCEASKEVNQIILDKISSFSKKYAEDSLLFEKVFCTIYAGMIAEENKSKAILKKRIKHLGVYHLLIEKRSAEYAANFSKGKTWQVIDNSCTERGI